MSKKLKICFAASSGGHFEQLMRLKPLMNRHNSFIITEKTTYKTTLDKYRLYYMKQINRKEIGFLWKMLVNTTRSIHIFFKEKPDVVISTGVLAVVPICLIAKLAGKKLIFIESFAKSTSPTLTGKLMYHFADQFYVQWESMLKVYPDAIYLGGIY